MSDTTTSDDQQRIAATRTHRMSDRRRSDFLTAYYKARSTAAQGGDLDELWFDAITSASTTPATLAGLIEGIAAGRGPAPTKAPAP